MIKIYADKKYQKYCARQLNKLYKKENPSVEVIPNGIIANEHVKGFGVFDENYRFVQSSVQSHKGRKGQLIPKFNHDGIPYIDSDAIYLCHTGRNHFGHFLLEHINRAWCLSDKKFKDAKIVIIDEKNTGKLAGYIPELLSLLGVKKQNIILLDKTTRFRNVYIPKPAFNMISFYTDAYADMYDYMAASVKGKESFEKIYVSRYALPENIRTFGEDKVQKIFEKNGYKVIYPETLPLKKQIELVKNCNVLAGCAGTALHLALFMKRGGCVIQIKRNSVLKDNAPIQQLINMAKGLDSVFVSGSVETVKTTHSSDIPQIIGVTKYMKQFFDENGFDYNNDDLIPNEKEIKAYENILAQIPHKNPVVKWLQRNFIHFSSCLIIGRNARKQYRRFLRSRWG